MKEVCYIITAFRDPYELPLACLDTLSEVANFLGVTIRHIYRHLCGEFSNIDGYVVHRVEL